jgi:hypothetical protein
MKALTPFKDPNNTVYIKTLRSGVRIIRKVSGLWMVNYNLNEAFNYLHENCMENIKASDMKSIFDAGTLFGKTIHPEVEKCKISYGDKL